MDDLVNRKLAIEVLEDRLKANGYSNVALTSELNRCIGYLMQVPSAKPTLYGYDIDHLALIAMILQKEGLPPERVAECLTDIGRIVDIVEEEFEEALRKALNNEDSY